MATIKVIKTEHYTVMSNHHLRNASLSLKAKGLLSVMFSLPPDWNYSVEGLAAICKEGESAVDSALRELKKAGYVVVKKIMPGQSESGHIEYEYLVYEIPQIEQKQDIEKQGVEIQAVENRPQLSKDKLNKEYIYTPYNPPTEQLQATTPTGDFPRADEGPCPENADVVTAEEISFLPKKPKKKRGEKPVKHRYGEHQNVLLSDEELEKLQERYPDDYLQKIESLSDYMKRVGKKYADHYLTLLKWLKEDADKSRDKGGGKKANQLELSSYDVDEFYEAAVKNSYGL